MAIPTVTFWNKDGRSVIINADDREAQDNWRELGFAPEGETVVEEEPEEVQVEVKLEDDPEDQEAADQAAGETKTRPRPSRSKKKK